MEMQLSIYTNLEPIPFNPGWWLDNMVLFDH